MGCDCRAQRSASLRLRRHIFPGLSVRAVVALELHGTRLFRERFVEHQRRFT